MAENSLPGQAVLPSAAGFMRFTPGPVSGSVRLLSCGKKQ